MERRRDVVVGDLHRHVRHLPQQPLRAVDRVPGEPERGRGPPRVSREGKREEDVFFSMVAIFLLRKKFGDGGENDSLSSSTPEIIQTPFPEKNSLSIAWGNCGHVFHLDCIQR